MNFLNFKKKSVVEENTLNADGTVNAEKVLEKHDKESKFRKLTGYWLILIVAVSVVFMGYHLITSRFGMPLVLKHRALHVGFIMFLIWAYYPATKHSRRDRPSNVDILLMIVTIAVTIYTMWNIELFAMRAGVALPRDFIFGAIMILLVLEGCRRVVGKGLLFLAIFFLLYVYFGRYFPGVFAHKGYRIERIIYQMYLTDQGIFGIHFLGCNA